MSNSVNIPEEEYYTLKADSLFLSCLQAMGVDNWPGYDDAVDHYERMSNLNA